MLRRQTGSRQGGEVAFVYLVVSARTAGQVEI